jgi:predicted DNA-binding transcriptional regulator YafY
MSVTEQLQELLSMLKSRRTGVTRRDVERHLDCSPATARRHLNRLRDEHHYPVVYEDGRYRLDGAVKVELPGVAFRPEELAALLGLVEWMEASGAGVLGDKLGPLRAQLESALADKGIPVREWRQRVRLLPQHYRRVDSDVLVTVVDAVLQRKRIILEYKGARDALHQERRLSPQRVVQYRHNWYVDAYDHGSRALRCFALSRARNVRVVAGEAREVPHEQLDAHFTEAYGIFGGRAKGKAVLVFEGEAARIVREEVWHPQQRVLELPGGHFRLEFPCGDVRELARDVMRFADEVTVESPPVLRAAVAEMVMRARNRFGAL